MNVSVVGGLPLLVFRICIGIASAHAMYILTMCMQLRARFSGKVAFRNAGVLHVCMGFLFSLCGCVHESRVRWHLEMPRCFKYPIVLHSVSQHCFFGDESLVAWTAFGDESLAIEYESLIACVCIAVRSSRS